jgi:hypothetical protein
MNIAFTVFLALWGTLTMLLWFMNMSLPPGHHHYLECVRFAGFLSVFLFVPTLLITALFRR